MFTWSENPMVDMWNHIKFFRNEYNCKRLLKGDIKGQRNLIYENGEDLEKKVKQITMSINQAIEYFEAAEHCSINTSPLLFFYGMLSLAKALIVANIKDIFLEDIKYHGLETRPKTDRLRAYISNPSLWNMEDEYAVTNEGVFKYLCELLGVGIFQNGSVIRFKDILSICPEISNMYEKYYNEPSKIMYLYNHEVISKNPYKIKISLETTDKEEVYSIFPELKEDFNISPSILHGQALEFISHDLPEKPEYYSLFNPLIGGQYAISGLPYEIEACNKKQVISQVAADYLAMFILSICVRYKQDFWGDVIIGKKNGSLGLVELYINIVKRRYPNFILNLLVGENFEYGSPARFM